MTRLTQLVGFRRARNAMRRRFAPIMLSMLAVACAVNAAPAPVAEPSGLLWEAEEALGVMRVVARLERGAMSFCRRRRVHVPGMAVAGRAASGAAERAAARELWGVGDTLQIVAIDPDGEAARAGLAVGDRIIRIGATRLPTGDSAVAAYRARMAAAPFLDPDTLVVTVSRAGEERVATLHATLGCGYDVMLVRSDDAVATAERDGVLLTTGLLNRLQGEDELAVVLSHEFAHLARHHESTRALHSAIGGILGGIGDAIIIASGRPYMPTMANSGAAIGAKAFSAQYEREADDGGLTLLARAGYDPDAALSFWRRMAAMKPVPRLLHEHPVDDERLVRMEATVSLTRASEGR